MKKNNPIGLLFIIILLFSCEKQRNETSSVKLTLIDENTNLCMGNVKITLFEWKNKTTIFGYSTDYDTKVLKEAFTDVNGQIDFGEFATKLDKDYLYGVAKGLVDPKQYNNIKKGENNNVILTLAGYSELKVKFIPPPPYNSNDSLSVQIMNMVIPSTIHRITNVNYTTANQIYLRPGYYSINIDKYKSGVYSNTKDTVLYSSSTAYEYVVYW